MNSIFAPPSTITCCETGLVSICLFRLSKWHYHYFHFSFMDLGWPLSCKLWHQLSLDDQIDRSLLSDAVANSKVADMSMLNMIAYFLAWKFIYIYMLEKFFWAPEKNHSEHPRSLGEALCFKQWALCISGKRGIYGKEYFGFLFL